MSRPTIGVRYLVTGNDGFYCDVEFTSILVAIIPKAPPWPKELTYTFANGVTIGDCYGGWDFEEVTTCP